MDATAARDRELNRLAREMRVVVGRLEDLLDAPYFPEIEERVAQRLGVPHLTEETSTRALQERQTDFAGLCCDYFHFATTKAYRRKAIAPVHVTSHLPGRQPEHFLHFFCQKLEEEFMKINRDHVGDMLLRAAMVHYRQSRTKPKPEHRKRMWEVLYGKRDPGPYRKLAARSGVKGLDSYATDYETESKKRFWSVAMQPEDIEEFLEHLLNRHQRLVVRKRVPPDYYVTELGALVGAMRLTSLYDWQQYKACYRTYKQKFTDFVLDERLDLTYAASLLRNRRRCGMHLQSIASRARDRQPRLETILQVIRRAGHRLAASPSTGPASAQARGERDAAPGTEQSG